MIDHLIFDHVAEFTPSCEKRKTYGRFLGAIFLEKVGSALVIERQWVALQQIPKNRKNAKKSVKYFPSDLRFSSEDTLLRRFR
jgi:hypothetical protein